MAYRMEIAETGGPEVIRRQDFTPEPPAPDEILVRQTAIGVNFIDTYHRTGLYPVKLPAVLGLEAAGVVEEVGGDVITFTPGDRIGYFLGPLGAYSTHRTIAASRVIKLPDALADDVAAGALLKAATAEFLIERCAHVASGQTALVQAAAGGVGLLLVQWLKAIGVRVIGTASSEAKADVARAHGADHVILYGDVALAIRDVTDNAGVDVVFDGVGKESWEGSLDSLRRRGLMISYGNASGPVGAVDFGILARKGSLFATRPTLFDYYATVGDFAAGTTRVLDMLATGAVKVEIGQRYQLSDAAEAHRDLKARRTTGSTVMIP